MTVPLNVKSEKRFLSAYREAREIKRGLWAKGQLKIAPSSYAQCVINRDFGGKMIHF